MPPLLGCMLILMSRRDTDGVFSEIGMLGILPTVVLFMPFLNFSTMLFNIFGVDPTGFRGLMLLPLPRYRTLLAKNLALAPFVCGIGYAMLAVAVGFLGVPWTTAALLILLVPQVYLAYVISGNAASIVFPYRLSRDTMRSQGDRLVLFFMGIASLVLAVALCAPAGSLLLVHGVGLAGWPSYAPPPSYTLAVGLLLLTAGLYYVALRHAGDWLLAREQMILTKLVREE